MKKSKRNPENNKQKVGSKGQIKQKKETLPQTPPLKKKMPKESKKTHHREISWVSQGKKSITTQTKNRSKSILFQKSTHQDQKYHQQKTPNRYRDALRQSFIVGGSKENKGGTPHYQSIKSDKLPFNINGQILNYLQGAIDELTKRDKDSSNRTQNASVLNPIVKRQKMMDLEQSRKTERQRECQFQIAEELEKSEYLSKQQIQRLSRQKERLHEKVVQLERSVETLKKQASQREQLLIAEFKIQKSVLIESIQTLKVKQADLTDQNRILQIKLENNECELVSLANNRILLEHKLTKYQSNAAQMRKENRDSKVRIGELQCMYECAGMRAEYEDKLVAVEIEKRQIKANAQEVLKILRDYQSEYENL